MSVSKIPNMIKELYRIVDELETMFPGRKFTPDGHLVGSIGEVLASYYYDIELYTASAECHDGVSNCGREVQVKATQGSKIGLRSNPEHLLVLKLNRDGTYTEIYNGPGSCVWDASGKMQKNGQRSISVTKLATLMKDVGLHQRLDLKKGA